MSRRQHPPSPRLVLTMTAVSAGLFLAGCSGASETTNRSGVVAATPPSTAPSMESESTVTSTTRPATTTTRSVATTATTSAASATDLDQSLAGIDRALAETDHQLTDADHDVATPEGDIR